MDNQTPSVCHTHKGRYGLVDARRRPTKPAGPGPSPGSRGTESSSPRRPEDRDLQPARWRRIFSPAHHTTEKIKDNKPMMADKA